VHDIIGDIVDWEEAHKVYLAAEGATGERYSQRLAAAEQMAEIDARWQHRPGGFHCQRKRIKIHIRAVADTAPSMSSEELCWLAIAAASVWVPIRHRLPQLRAGHGRTPSQRSAATVEPGTVRASISGTPGTRI
jgi:hypothetical protein